MIRFVRSFETIAGEQGQKIPTVMNEFDAAGNLIRKTEIGNNESTLCVNSIQEFMAGSSKYSQYNYYPSDLTEIRLGVDEMKDKGFIAEKVIHSGDWNGADYAKCVSIDNKGELVYAGERYKFYDDKLYCFSKGNHYVKNTADEDLFFDDDKLHEVILNYGKENEQIFNVEDGKLVRQNGTEEEIISEEDEE